MTRKRGTAARGQHRPHRLLLIAGAVSALTLVPSAASAAPVPGRYTTIDVPGAADTVVVGVNDEGVASGFYTDSSGNDHGFLDRGGAFTTINVPGAADTFVTVINDVGVVVGYDIDSSGAAHGFVDTGDIVELRGDRYYFVGRRGGIINIGGLKVHPEEVEAAINRHPSVRMSLVKARRNPITGAIVVADVVVKSRIAAARKADALKREIIEVCRGALDRHKVPATINFVPALEVAASGKLVRAVA